MSDMMGGVDPRDAARMVGKMLGREDLAEEILSGDMPARAALSLVAGMVHMAVSEVAVNILRAERWTGFDPEAITMQGMLHLKDGSAIMITMEAL